MKILLDTHTFLWWTLEPAKLSQPVLTVCQEKENLILLSVASAWEMQIKLQSGKLKIDLPSPRYHAPRGNAVWTLRVQCGLVAINLVTTRGSSFRSLDAERPGGITTRSVVTR